MTYLLAILTALQAAGQTPSETAWTWSVKRLSDMKAEARVPFETFEKALKKDRGLDPTQPLQLWPSKVGLNPRVPVATGDFPEVIPDGAAWDKALKFLEGEAKVPSERIAELKKAKPDFSKSMILALVLSTSSRPGSSTTRQIKEIWSDGDELKVHVLIQNASGGPAPPPGPELTTHEVRLIRVEKAPKKVVIQEEFKVALHP
jgi:hypothetical protein